MDETAGEILTYNEALISAAQYGASNGGQTKPYKDYPYFAAKPDPWDAAETARMAVNGQAIRRGNGIGLSQYGARYAASIGIGYRDILAFYYPGTAVTHIQGKEGDTMPNTALNPTEQQIKDWAMAQVGKGYVWGAMGETLTRDGLNQ